MEDQEKQDQKLMVCKYFLHGFCCFSEENCEYAHYMTNILPEDVMCEYHIRGCCKYGRKCWSRHSNKKKKAKSSKVVEDKINWRFSFALNHVRKIRAEFAKHPMHCQKFPKSLEEFLKLKPIKDIPTVKLPMDKCIHFRTGECDLGRDCSCLHGNFCDLCQKYCLDPSDLEQQRHHVIICTERLEKDLELSFAIQCSLDKVCGICLELVIEKEVIKDRRFGILEKCNHVFCLSCIREWRKRVNTIDALQEDLDEPVLDERLVRACPQCRVSSDFVTPSQYWFLTNAEKQQRIESYKAKLKTKPCKYFKESNTCPFGGLCFYCHALPDGTLVELPSPKKRPRRNRTRNRNVEIFEDFIMWHYEEGDENLYFLEEDPQENFIFVNRPHSDSLSTNFVW